jgi:hypothetical protein
MNLYILRNLTSTIPVRTRSFSINILKSPFDLKRKYCLNDLRSILTRNNIRRFSISSLLYDDPAFGKDFLFKVLKLDLFNA